MSLKQDCRAEFCRWKATFGKCQPARFYVCQRWNVSIPLLLFRCLAFLFTISILTVTWAGQSSALGYTALVAFTIWSYIILTSYFFTASMTSIFCVIGDCMAARASRRQTIVLGKSYSSSGKPDSEGQEQTTSNPRTQTPTASNGHTGEGSTVVIQEECGLPWYMIVQWCLYNIALPSAILVTLIYWGMLYPLMHITSTNFVDISLHALNLVLMLIEQYLSSIPTRILHVYQPIIYGIVYMIFSAVFWSQTGLVLYPYVLDWNRPGITAASMCGLLLYFFVTQLVLFLIFRLRQTRCQTVHDN